MFRNAMSKSTTYGVALTIIIGAALLISSSHVSRVDAQATGPDPNDLFHKNFVRVLESANSDAPLSRARIELAAFAGNSTCVNMIVFEALRHRKYRILDSLISSITDERMKQLPDQLQCELLSITWVRHMGADDPRSWKSFQYWTSAFEVKASAADVMEVIRYAHLKYTEGVINDFGRHRPRGQFGGNNQRLEQLYAEGCFKDHFLNLVREVGRQKPLAFQTVDVWNNWRDGKASLATICGNVPDKAFVVPAFDWKQQPIAKAKRSENPLSVVGSNAAVFIAPVQEIVERKEKWQDYFSIPAQKSLIELKIKIATDSSVRAIQIAKCVGVLISVCEYRQKRIDFTESKSQIGKPGTKGLSLPSAKLAITEGKTIACEFSEIAVERMDSMLDSWTIFAPLVSILVDGWGEASGVQDIIPGRDILEGFRVFCRLRKAVAATPATTADELFLEQIPKAAGETFLGSDELLSIYSIPGE